MVKVRRADTGDIDKINKLLYQVHKVHSDARPDIFKSGLKKYTTEELQEILMDDTTPIFVSVDDLGDVTGYIFCIYQDTEGISSLVDRKVLFIDDFCVDSNIRGQNIGSQLYSFIEEEAARNKCDAITLNVWNFNDGAIKFYERLGFSTLKIVLEKKL